MLADEAHVVKAARKSPEAFARLYEHYVDRIFGYVYLRVSDKPTAEDITASVFEKALANIGSFRWRGISFSAYLLRIARNELADAFKESRRWASLPEQASGAPSSEQSIQYQEEVQELYAALSRLRDSDQDIIRLRFLLELPVAEVADMLNCSADNVYVRLHRALNRLRAELQRAPHVSLAMRGNDNVSP